MSLKNSVSGNASNIGSMDRSNPNLYANLNRCSLFIMRSLKMVGPSLCSLVVLTPILACWSPISVKIFPEALDQTGFQNHEGAQLRLPDA